MTNLEALLKAIDNASAFGLGLLRKSQLGLFDPHHIEYQRRNRSGTISRIASRGAPRFLPAGTPAQGVLDFSGPAPVPPPVPRPRRVPKPKPLPPRADHKLFIAKGKAIFDRLYAVARAQVDTEVRGTLPGTVYLKHTRSLEGAQRILVEEFKRPDREERLKQAGKVGGTLTEPQKAALVEFYKITGLKATSRQLYRSVEMPAGSRAHANALHGTINVTRWTDGATIQHEAAHHLEFNDHALRGAAILFRNERARSTGNHTLEPLKTLVPHANYGPEEKALRDSFINPYVGKCYTTDPDLGGPTEVISMGMPHLLDQRKFVDLAEKDPEHLHFMIGMLQYLKDKEPFIKETPSEKQDRLAQKRLAAGSR